MPSWAFRNESRDVMQWALSSLSHGGVDRPPTSLAHSDRFWASDAECEAVFWYDERVNGDAERE